MTDDSSFVPSSGEGSDSEQDTSLRRTNLKSRPSVSGTGHGKRDQDLLLEIEKRRQQFRVPANLKSQGFEPFRLTRPSRSTAISFGVKLVVYKDKEKTVLDETLTCYWCCLVCNNQPLRMRHDNTSAATSHLR